MARSRRKPSNSRSGGITLFGIMVGLILGLAAAVAVALFVTQVPMPFADKFSREPAKVALPDARNAPDPNVGLFGNAGGAGTQPSGPTDTTIKPGAPGTGSEPKETLDQLLANLNATGTTPATPAPSRPAPGTEAPAQASGSSAAKPAPTPAPAAGNATNNQTTYYLQAGAFRSEADAQAMQARILLLGMPVSIQKATVNGENINRVRVGPFKGIDDMNRSRAQLGEEKIATSVVRP